MNRFFIEVINRINPKKCVEFLSGSCTLIVDDEEVFEEEISKLVKKCKNTNELNILKEEFVVLSDLCNYYIDNKDILQKGIQYGLIKPNWK